MGGVLVALCGLGGAALGSLGGASTPVVVATTGFSAGHVIAAQDVRVEQLEGTPQLTAVSSTDQVIGKVATAPVAAGGVLTPAITQHAPVVNGAVVGISVKPSGLPVRGLSAGDRVQIFAGGNAAGAPAAAQQPQVKDAAPAQGPWSGSVLAVGEVREDGTRSIDVQMSRPQDAAAAARVAGGGEAVIVVAATQSPQKG